jgi:uncharacterized protein (TIGR02217 family)
MTAPIINADLAEVFPTCPTFGFISEPQRLVKITSREGGYERRDLKWARSLRAYTSVPMGSQSEDEILDILDFWEAMGGMWSGFRFKDWIDYKSCRRSETPAATDQPLQLSGDSPTSYRLIKNYPTKSGRTVAQREIARPIGSTIMIANELGAAQTAWTLDESTGILTIDGGFVGTPTAWGGEFDVWCRFDAQFNPAASNYKIMDVTVQLKEIRVPLA